MRAKLAADEQFAGSSSSNWAIDELIIRLAVFRAGLADKHSLSQPRAIPAPCASTVEANTAPR